MQKSIFLVGFMGSGKSHVGRKLAAALNCPFLDLDQIIEARAGMTISELFAAKGEAVFRLLERRALHDTAFLESGIIATGGGTACYFQNMQWMNKQGIPIFLDASPDILAQRLWKGRLKRPLLMGLSQSDLPGFIAGKLAERRPYYEMAAVQYMITDPELNHAQHIAEQLTTITGH